jgi:hypothetical protein
MKCLLILIPLLAGCAIFKPINVKVENDLPRSGKIATASDKVPQTPLFSEKDKAVWAN